MAGALGFLVHNVSDGAGKRHRFEEDVYEKGRDREQGPADLGKRMPHGDA
jgi:hypothetical protein